MLPCPGTTPTSLPTWRRAGRPWCARWCCSAAARPRPRTSPRPGSRGATRAWDRVRRGDDVDAYVYARRPRLPAQSTARRVPGARRCRPRRPAEDGDRRRAAAARARGPARPAGPRRARGGGAALRRRALRGAGRRRARRTARVRAGADHPRARRGSTRRMRVRPATAEIFRRASESIEVLAAAGRRGRRRGARPAGAGGCARSSPASAAAAVVLGGLTWLANRGPADDGRAPPAGVTSARPNPVQVAWYANGRLHLEKVAVDGAGRHRPRRAQRRCGLRRPARARSCSSPPTGSAA